MQSSQTYSTHHSDAELEHSANDLIRLFNKTFSESFNTRLVRGDGEPIYLPADDQCTYHQVVFAHGYFSSALHEIAHWCIAGHQRRQQVDYGYWYAPDGRSVTQQLEFEHVEIKPQALEWMFSRACGKTFRVSIDNLNGESADTLPFKNAVYQQVINYCKGSEIPKRAHEFINVLCDFYCQRNVYNADVYLLEQC